MGIAYSDTSGGQGILQRIETYTGLGRGNVTGNTNLKQDFTLGINTHYQELWALIMEYMGTFELDDRSQTDYPEGQFTGVAAQRDYPFASSLKLLKLNNVLISYDGVTATPAIEIQEGELTGNPSTDDSKFNSGSPRYDVKYNSLWIYPRFTAAQVTAGAYIYYQYLREPIQFTTSDTTKVSGLDAPFDDLLAILPSLDYCNDKVKDKVPWLISRKTELEKLLKLHYSRKVISSNRAVPLRENNR